MATDGCLVNTGRHLAFTSGDADLMETLLSCLDRPLRYRAVRTKAGGTAFWAQFGDVMLYRWLQAVGLMQRKSLVLGALHVPDEYFFHSVRGLLDGDGSVINLVHRPTLKTYADYRYERLWVKFHSASQAHTEWLRTELEDRLGIKGYIELPKLRPGRHQMYNLKYGKHASIRLLSRLYEDADAPRLLRKWRIWESYRLRNLVPKGGVEPPRACAPSS
jgi:aromatic ring-cleaving dioxygenase